MQEFQIDINIGEVARYLGYKNSQLEERTKAEIEFATAGLKKVMNPKATYKVFEIRKKIAESGKKTIEVVGTSLVFESEDIFSLLEDSHKVVLMAVTLGNGVDEIIRRLQISSMEKALVADFCGSSLAENLADVFEEKLKGEVLEIGEFFTDRFSPGYGDLDISVQGKFCSVINAQRSIGLNVSKSNLMIPRKSITAILGIANKKQKKKIKGCAFCDFASECQYRKDGKFCG